MLLIIDNTQNSSVALYLPMLIDMITKLQVSYILVTSYDEMKEALMKHRKTLRGVILSGSQLMISQMNHQEYIDIFTMNLVAVTLCGMKWHLPVLGICFGCQFLYTFFGGSLQQLPKPTCTDHTIRIVQSNKD